MNQFNIKIKFIFYLILWIKSGITFSQAPIRFSHFNDLNGLSHYQAWSVFQDSKGVYWIGTTDGLNRFDGGIFKQYFQSKDKRGSICGNVITNTIETSANQLLIGTSTGISQYNSDDNTFKTVYTPNEDNSNDNFISYIQVDKKGFIWIAFRYQVIILNSNFQFYKKLNSGFVGGNSIYKMQADQFGDVWINISGYLHKYSLKNGFSSQNKSNSTLGIFQKPIADFSIGAEGKICVADLEGNSIRCFQSESVPLFSLSTPTIPQLRWLNIYVCRSGKIWLTSKEHGIFRIKDQKWDVQELMHSSIETTSICTNDVKQIVEDDYGNTWFGTDGGLDVIYKEPIEPINYFEYTLHHNKKNELLYFTSMQSDSSTIWITSWGKGLCTIDRNSGNYFFNSPSLDDKDLFMTDLNLFDKELWIGNYKGCYRYDLESKKYNLQKFNSTKENGGNQFAVIGIYRDLANNLWISFTQQNGILYLNRKTGTTRRYTQKDTNETYFPFRNVSAFTQTAGGRIIFGYSRSRGLGFFNSKINQFEKFSTGNKSLFNEQVNCLLSDDPYLWIGNNTGVCRIDLRSGKRHRLTRNDGLPGNTINTLLKDPNGSIWIGTKRGLARVDPATMGIINFNLIGLSTDINIHVINYNKELGLIECLSDKSYFSFRLPNEKNLKLTHKPSVFSCSIAGEAIKPNDDKSIHFSEKDKVFVISFYCPVNPALGKLHYSYKLKGFDKNWIQAGELQQAIYSTLPSGNYSLLLRASLDGINWVESEHALSVIVDPIFYKSKWFITLVVMLSMLLIIVILHLRNNARLKNLIYVQEMRNRIAADLHDDIASTLSSISMMSEFASKKMNSDLSSVQGLLNKIGKHSRQLISEMSDIVWSVNPEHDNIDSLIARMNDFAATILQDKGIEFQMNKSIDKDTTLFNPHVRKNVFLIFKEAIHNAVKHAECNDVRIQLTVEENTIKMKIEDNGKGFDVEKYSNGNGLKNMKKRAEQIHAEFSIDSNIGKGSFIQLIIKLSVPK